MKNKHVIARKYAKAFLNVYLEDISLTDFNSIKNLSLFFIDHKKSLFFYLYQI